MKRWLESMRGMKNGLWLLALAVCAAAFFLLPAQRMGSAGMTEEEQRISATLSQIAGAGQVCVSITYSQAASAFGGGKTEPIGAVIVAQGAGSVEVRLNLLRAAEALLGLTAQEVEVFRMEEAP